MTYAAGIDLGTTFTAAATVDQQRSFAVVPLTQESQAIPSLTYLGADGSYLFGHEAATQGQRDPGRLARNVKRRMGDPAPILLGGSPVAAHLLTARLLEWTMGQVVEQRGSAPVHTVLTHPANWSTYKVEFLAQAADSAAVGPYSLLSEPEAAAFQYASTVGSSDDAVVVYDLGGGTFDASVLARGPGGLSVVGEPQGVESLGGIDFDEAILQWVLEQLDVDLYELDHTDIALQTEMLLLRRACTDAKVALSSATEADIEASFAGHNRTLTLTRATYEQRIAPLIDETIRALARAVSAASLGPDDIDRVLLVGGSSRTPLVQQALQERFGRPLYDGLDADFSVTSGAAWFAAEQLDAPAPVQSGRTTLGTATIVVKPEPTRSLEELIEGDIWTDAEIAATGMRVEQVQLASVGGGLASFALIDVLHSGGLQASDIAVVTDAASPTEDFAMLARHAGLADGDSVPEYDSWPVDDPRVDPTGGLGDVLSWNWTSNPPSVGQFVQAVDAEGQRIGWPEMVRPGGVRAIRRCESGGYVCLVRPPRGSEEQPSLLRSRFVHLGLGRSRIAVNPVLQSIRATQEQRRIASVFEPHQNLLVTAAAQRGSVAVLGNSVLARQISVRAEARGIRVGQLTQPINNAVLDGERVSIDGLAYDYVIDTVEHPTAADDHRVVRELVDRGAPLQHQGLLVTSDHFEISELSSRDGHLFAGGALVDGGSHGFGSLGLLQGQALAIVDYLAGLGFGAGVSVTRRNWGKLGE